MQRLVTGVTAVVLVVWTLLCLVGYGLLNWIGDTLVENADVVPASPEGVVFVSWALRLLQNLGFGALIVVWLIGAAVVLGIAFVLRRFTASARGRYPDV